MQRYDTLRSLAGIRADVALLDTQPYDAALCARQLVDNRVQECMRSTNISVWSRIASILFQGIDVDLVTLNDTVWGMWEEEENAFSGVLSHVEHGVDTLFEAWSK